MKALVVLFILSASVSASASSQSLVQGVYKLFMVARNYKTKIPNTDKLSDITIAHSMPDKSINIKTTQFIDNIYNDATGVMSANARIGTEVDLVTRLLGRSFNKSNLGSMTMNIRYEDTVFNFKIVNGAGPGNHFLIDDIKSLAEDIYIKFGKEKSGVSFSSIDQYEAGLGGFQQSTLTVSSKNTKAVRYILDQLES